MPTIAHDIQISATFRLVDDAGNTQRRHTLPPIVLDSLTPLSMLALYETLSAKRNETRRAAGLPELAQPDVAVVLLESLRQFAASGADPSIERIAECVCEVVGEIARERGREWAIMREREMAEALRNGREPAEVT